MNRILSKYFKYAVVMLLLTIAILVHAAGATELDNNFSEDLDSDMYDCSVVLNRSVDGRPMNVKLYLEWQSDRDCIRLDILNNNVIINSIKAGTIFKAGSLKISSTIEKKENTEQINFSIHRRGDSLAIFDKEKMLLNCKVNHAPGNIGRYVATGEGTIDINVNKLEPVFFTDDFMRTADDQNQWKVATGEWEMRSAWDDVVNSATTMDKKEYAQNPFAWAGRAKDDKAAFCTTGLDTWEDYNFSTSICPGGDGAVGIAANIIGQNYLLVKWLPASAQNANTKKITLLNIAGTAQTELKSADFGYLPGQWYRMSIISNLSGVTVLIDGHEVLSSPPVYPTHGGVGLYCDGKAGAIFDDVSVIGSGINEDIVHESQQTKINDKFKQDNKGMAVWASVKSEWKPIPGAPGYLTHRSEFYGNHWVVMDLKIPEESLTGSLDIILSGDGKSVDNGYRLSARMGAGKDIPELAIYRNGLVVATGKLGIVPGEDFSLRFKRLKSKLIFTVDDEIKLEYDDANPINGLKPSYHVDGSFAGIGDVLVMGENNLDYVFTGAPSDWVNEGTWEATTRWSCAPQWSFLAGWGASDVALWHKKIFTGDQLLQTFVGVKMEYPYQREIYDNRYRDLGITICGDGKNPHSGYSAIYGAPSKDGATPNMRTVLLRNGVEVAECAVRMPGRNEAHNSWFNLELRKHGGVVEFLLGGTLLLTYTDPVPIEGGIPAVWTTDNGISVARVRLNYANAPVARKDIRVQIDQPEYGNWVNIGETININFPRLCSTSGRQVKLQIKKHTAPVAETDDAIKIVGNSIAFTPKAVGDHWYEITGVDGDVVSAPFNLIITAFDKTKTIDNSHALYLYNFDTGKGNRVLDVSPIAPALNINIPINAKADWNKGGLRLSSSTPLVSIGTTSKLQAIEKSKQMSVEIWFLPDTLYPNNDLPEKWFGVFCTAQVSADMSIFNFGHHSNRVVAANMYNRMVENPQTTVGRWKVGLQHIVYTWSGTQTTLYVNGVSTGENATIAWLPEQWSKVIATWPPLLIGNDVSGIHGIMGTFYKLAIHDKSFDKTEIMERYTAGPSVR
jgi:hypothetical protein